MGSLFSSPGKQASQAASAAGAISQQDIQQLEQYVTGQQQQLRGAIAGQGPNPFFAAGQDVNPANYQVNPNYSVNFGSQGQGTTTVPATAPVVNPYGRPPQQGAPSNPNPKPPSQPAPTAPAPVNTQPPGGTPPSSPFQPPVKRQPPTDPGEGPIGPIGRSPISPAPSKPYRA